MRELLVWGAGGHGRVVADAARAAGWSVAGYADGNSLLLDKVVDDAGGRVILPDDRLSEWLAGGGDRFVALGVGANQARLARALDLPAERLPVVIHPRAVVAAGVQIGAGSVVLAGAVLNIQAVVGRAVIINTAAVVEHDVEIGDGVHVSPGAVLTGACSVAELSWIGANATLLPGVRVGAGCMVGAGSMVRKPVPDGATMVGNPARRIK